MELQKGLARVGLVALHRDIFRANWAPRKSKNSALAVANFMLDDYDSFLFIIYLDAAVCIQLGAPLKHG
jgi:hypothetical protein